MAEGCSASNAKVGSSILSGRANDIKDLGERAVTVRVPDERFDEQLAAENRRNIPADAGRGARRKAERPRLIPAEQRRPHEHPVQVLGAGEPV